MSRWPIRIRLTAAFVAAPGQVTPGLPEGVLVVRDTVSGRGPLQGIAAGLDARAADLHVRLDRAREVGERLEVKLADLSGAERIRDLAAEKLGMHEPKSTTLKVYGVRVEDGKNDGAPQEGGRPRQR